MKKEFCGFWENFIMGEPKEPFKEFSILIDFIEECWHRKTVRIYFKRSNFVVISNDVIIFFEEILGSKKFTLEIESAKTAGDFCRIVLVFLDVKFPDFFSKIKLPQKEEGGKKI